MQSLSSHSFPHRFKTEEQAADVLENQAAKIAIIREQFALANRQPVNLGEASFEDAVLLLSLIRAGGNEDFSAIAPLSTLEQPFAPTDALALEFLGQLYQEGWISVHPDTYVDSVEFEGDNITFDLDQVQWALSIESAEGAPAQTAAHVEAMLQDKNHWLTQWQAQQSEFSRKIALYECLQYLEFSLTEQGFPFSTTDKTFLVLDSLLNDYSVAQIFNFIWRATRDTVAFYQREPAAKKQHAANTIVDSIQKQAADAKAGHWEVKPYHRSPKLPQSTVSAALFDAVLQVGDDGFYKPLHDDAPSL